jgi:hypothetical protein
VPNDRNLNAFRARARERGLKGAPCIQTDRVGLVALDELDVDKISDRRIPFTEQRAIDYIELPVFPGEREVNEAHVQFLHDQIRARRFNWDLVQIAKADFEGKTYKINGQHCAWLRFSLGVLEVEPQVREIHYSVKSIAQLKTLYGTFDRAKPRTDPHLVRVELVGTPAAEGLTSRQISRLAPAFRFWKYGDMSTSDDARRCGAAELAAMIQADYSQLFNIVGHFIYAIQGDKLAMARIDKMSVIAAMIDNFNKVPTLAPEFWRPVAESTGLEKDDARWHLVRYLDSIAMQRSNTNSMKRIVSTEEVYRVCIAAWNRWRAGERVSQLRPTAKRVKSA